MFGIPVRVPFLLVMLLATLWVFALVWWKPELVSQKAINRFYVSLLESLVCGLVWGFVLSIFSAADPIEARILSALLSGVFWFCVVFYSRLRYAKALEHALSPNYEGNCQ